VASIEPLVDHLEASTREIDRIYEAQQRNRARVAQAAARDRILKLRKLHDAVLAHREDIRAAMWADYRKPAAEVDLAELLPVVQEARFAMRRLKRWMRPQRVATPLALLGSSSRIVYEPKGVVLIISPWNFPFNLSLGPLISAVAAGNCVVLKPSEMTPHAAACMKQILGEVFGENEVAVVEGDASVAEKLLAKRWDHIFFTGSPRVGKVVMHAAAEHLTSVTLELGGKSPTIVDRTADLDEAAHKIAWGKFFNSGQICIAPDYLLVDESIRGPFVEKLRAAIDQVFSTEGSRGWVVNSHHAGRMKHLFDEAVKGGAEVVAGGTFNDRDIAPTVIAYVTDNAGVMQQEIFGPLLPMTSYRDLGEALEMIASREKPLVLYLFSRDAKVKERVLRETSAGGTAINDTLVHFYQLNLPFGGVGHSGMGKAHGRFGFDAFSNARGVLEQPFKFSGIQLMYPPYTKLKQKLIDFTLRWL
jgi:aldehyde dehydrogenase (NAD+)